MLVMQELESEESLPENVLAAILGVAVLHRFNHRGQCEVHKLHEDPESVSEIERFIDLQDNFCVFAHIHEGYLIIHKHLLTVVFRLNKFESADHAIGLTLYFEDLGEATYSKLVLTGNVVVLRWVLLLEVCMLIKVDLELLGRRQFNRLGRGS